MTMINESIDMHDSLNRILRNAEKANLVLDTWMEEYCFASDAKPKTSLIKESIESEEGKEHYNTFKWTYEYNRIVNLVDIVSDYVDEIRGEIYNMNGKINNV